MCRSYVAAECKRNMTAPVRHRTSRSCQSLACGACGRRCRGSGCKREAYPNLLTLLRGATLKCFRGADVVHAQRIQCRRDIRRVRYEAIAEADPRRKEAFEAGPERV